MERERLENLRTSDVEGGIGGKMLDLQEAIDWGWRNFWKRRGFSHPPELYGEENWFAMKHRGHEKEQDKFGKRQA